MTYRYGKYFITREHKLPTLDEVEIENDCSEDQNTPFNNIPQNHTINCVQQNKLIQNNPINTENQIKFPLNNAKNNLYNNNQVQYARDVKTPYDNFFKIADMPESAIPINNHHKEKNNSKQPNLDIHTILNKNYEFKYSLPEEIPLKSLIQKDNQEKVSSKKSKQNAEKEVVQDDNKLQHNQGIQVGIDILNDKLNLDKQDDIVIQLGNEVNNENHFNQYTNQILSICNKMDEETSCSINQNRNTIGTSPFNKDVNENASNKIPIKSPTVVMRNIPRSNRNKKQNNIMNNDLYINPENLNHQSELNVFNDNSANANIDYMQQNANNILEENSYQANSLSTSSFQNNKSNQKMELVNQKYEELLHDVLQITSNSYNDVDNYDYSEECNLNEDFFNLIDETESSDQNTVPFVKHESNDSKSELVDDVNNISCLKPSEFPINDISPLSIKTSIDDNLFQNDSNSFINNHLKQSSSSPVNADKRKNQMIKTDAAIHSDQNLKKTYNSTPPKSPNAIHSRKFVHKFSPNVRQSNMQNQNNAENNSYYDILQENKYAEKVSPKTKQSPKFVHKLNQERSPLNTNNVMTNSNSGKFKTKKSPNQKSKTAQNSSPKKFQSKRSFYNKSNQNVQDDQIIDREGIKDFISSINQNKLLINDRNSIKKNGINGKEYLNPKIQQQMKFRIANNKQNQNECTTSQPKEMRANNPPLKNKTPVNDNQLNPLSNSEIEDEMNNMFTIRNAIDILNISDEHIEIAQTKKDSKNSTPRKRKPKSEYRIYGLSNEEINDAHIIDMHDDEEITQNNDTIIIIANENNIKSIDHHQFHNFHYIDPSKPNFYAELQNAFKSGKEIVTLTQNRDYINSRFDLYNNAPDFPPEIQLKDRKNAISQETNLKKGQVRTNCSRKSIILDHHKNKINVESNKHVGIPTFESNRKQEDITIHGLSDQEISEGHSLAFNEGSSDIFDFDDDIEEDSNNEVLSNESILNLLNGSPIKTSLLSNEGTNSSEKILSMNGSEIIYKFIKFSNPRFKYSLSTLKSFADQLLDKQIQSIL